MKRKRKTQVIPKIVIAFLGRMIKVRQHELFVSHVDFDSDGSDFTQFSAHGYVIGPTKKARRRK